MIGVKFCDKLSSMSHKFSASIIKEGKWYVARALELDVVSQGKTVADATRNLQEAVELYLEDRPSEYRGLILETPLFTTIEV